MEILKKKVKEIIESYSLDPQEEKTYCKMADEIISVFVPSDFGERCQHGILLENACIQCDKDEALKSVIDSALNSQEGGDHYKKLGEYQPWVVLSKWMTPEELKGAMKKDIIAYLARESDKGGREDIKKAHHTLGIYLELTDSE